MHFYKWLQGTRHHFSKQETDRTARTITKALTETINCICRVKKSGGHDKKFPALRAGQLSPTLKFVPAALPTLNDFLLRSDSSGD